MASHGLSSYSFPFMNYRKYLSCLLLGAVLGFAFGARAQVPEWIWSTKNNTSTNKEVRFFRKEFQNQKGNHQSRIGWSAAMTSVEIYLNGKKVVTSTDWAHPETIDVAKDTSSTAPMSSPLVAKTPCVAPPDLSLKLELTTPTYGSVAQKFDPSQTTLACAGLTSLPPNRVGFGPTTKSMVGPKSTSTMPYGNRP